MSDHMEFQENFSAKTKWMPVFQYDSCPNILQKLGENVIVPIGIVMTMGCYAVGLSSLATNRPKLGQKMMYSRIAFQGMTIATMFYGQWLDQKTKDSITYNNQHYNLKSSFLHPSIN